MLSLDRLDTEKRNINTMNLDELSTVEIIEKINQEDKKVADCVEPVIPEIGKAVDFAVKSIKEVADLFISVPGHPADLEFWMPVNVHRLTEYLLIW